MRIFVRSKPRAKKTAVQKTSEHNYTVMVPAEPTDGKANDAILEALSKYFNLPKNLIVMESGEKSHLKVYVINTARVPKEPNHSA
ncbi:MAG TPA: DUF167 domain-containing protein [Candidatus Saccharimonadales bacterium]|nr:DUF167 domain-containing protein [Candidatus Saccharimonadales bacterium]